MGYDEEENGDHVIPDKVCLNVGGRLFETSLQTLTQRDSDSMLGIMFSGRHPLKLDSRGAVFIDRDGKHFRHILNWLRDGSVPLPHPPLYQELMHEAQYYQLESFHSHLSSALKSEEEGGAGGAELSRKEVILALQHQRVRFRGVNLSGVDLSKLDLSSVDFSLSTLSGCFFSRANLQSALFRECHADQCNFHNAMLKECDFERASLRGAVLSGTNLTSANLQDACLVGASLCGADLRSAHLQGADLRGANLSNANLEGANLKSAQLSGANLHASNLQRAYLRDVDLRETINMDGANLFGANLQGAIRRTAGDVVIG